MRCPRSWSLPPPSRRQLPVPQPARADRKASGGAGSIAEQLAESGLDVILGGGRRHFAPLAEGSAMSVLELARERGFKVVTSGEAPAAVNREQRQVFHLMREYLGLQEPPTPAEQVPARD